MDTKTTLRNHFRQYIRGQLNEQEVRTFLLMVQSGRNHETIQELIQETLADPADQTALEDSKLLATLDGSWTVLQHRIQAQSARRAYLLRRIIAVAAILVGILTVGVWAILHKDGANTDLIAQQKAILPGTQTATLTLTNGQQIRLQDADNGQLVEEAGVHISKTADGQLIYEIKDNDDPSTGYNTLSTASGETYKVCLPDGTQVWLNAVSSITYPINFALHDTRNVELEGEAYFEVAKDSERPFIVHAALQQIEVLGTRFNINSYADEPMVRTTLVEGSIRVHHGENDLRLQPGEQSVLSASGTLKVNPVDTESATAWVNNEFMFDGDDIESVMRKIARWYNVNVVYQGKKTNERFGGGLSRFDRIEQVLQLLGKTGTVHFKIEGRTIYVLP